MNFRDLTGEEDRIRTSEGLQVPMAIVIRRCVLRPEVMRSGTRLNCSRDEHRRDMFPGHQSFEK